MSQLHHGNLLLSVWILQACKQDLTKRWPYAEGIQKVSTRDEAGDWPDIWFISQTAIELRLTFFFLLLTRQICPTSSVKCSAADIVDGLFEKWWSTVLQARTSLRWKVLAVVLSFEKKVLFSLYLYRTFCETFSYDTWPQSCSKYLSCSCHLV